MECRTCGLRATTVGGLNIDNRCKKCAAKMKVSERVKTLKEDLDDIPYSGGPVPGITVRTGLEDKNRVECRCGTTRYLARGVGGWTCENCGDMNYVGDVRSLRNPGMIMPAKEFTDGIKNTEAVMGPGTGRKDDTGKPPYDLIAPELLDDVARVLAFGAQKYEPRNWERGMKWSRVFAGAMRHLWAWWGGEDKDKETGLSHLAHAACCVMFLLAYEKRKTGEDDRFKING